MIKIKIIKCNNDRFPWKNKNKKSYYQVLILSQCFPTREEGAVEMAQWAGALAACPEELLGQLTATCNPSCRVFDTLFGPVRHVLCRQTSGQNTLYT